MSVHVCTCSVGIFSVESVAATHTRKRGSFAVGVVTDGFVFCVVSCMAVDVVAVAVAAAAA